MQHEKLLEIKFMNTIKLKDAEIQIDTNWGLRGAVFIKVRPGDRRQSFCKFFPEGLGETTLEQFIKLMESAR
jgi:hypothetical protein